LAIVFIETFIITNNDEADDDHNDFAASSTIFRCYFRRRTQTPLFTFSASQFPNSSGPFNRSFGIGGQQPNRPKSPLSSLGGIFSTAGSINSSFTSMGFVVNFPAPDKLLEGDFGIDFPIDYDISPESTNAPTKSPSKSPSSQPQQQQQQVVTKIPTRSPSKSPSHRPTVAPSHRPTTVPTVAPVVPPPLKFFAQDFNPNGLLLDLSSFPNSKMMRDAFLAYFNETKASLQQSFENNAVDDVGPFLLTTIGSVDFIGSVVGVRLSSFATHGRASLSASLRNELTIVFPEVVTGAGYTVSDLGTAGGLVSPYNVQFKRNGTVVDTLAIELNTSMSVSGGVVFIGYINYVGFDTIVMPGIGLGDGILIDQLNAFLSSELL
jgi:hypothetical protein